MKILFMGTPDFAVPILNSLVEEGHAVCAVITQPDKPAGRGFKLSPPPVKRRALELGIPVYQPETLKNEAILPLLQELSPELIAVAAYGKILPGYVLDFPPRGCLNVHASLLPKYRGAAPIHHAILNGEAETGVTIMYMERGLDTGDMLLKARTPITEEDTVGTLHDRLAALGGPLLCRAIADLDSLTPEKQDDAAHTYAPMIEKEDARLDLSQPAEALARRVRALSPAPGAFLFHAEKPFKVLFARPVPGSGSPGEILAVDRRQGLVIACGEGALKLESVRPQGKPTMTAEQYLTGHPLRVGDLF